MLDITAVNDEAVAQNEWFFAGQRNRLAARINRILHTALSPEYPSLGIARQRFVTQDSQAAYLNILVETTGKVQPGPGFYGQFSRFHGTIAAGKTKAIGQSYPG